MKIRFGIILLPLLLPFIYASAHFPEGKETFQNLGYASVQRDRVGLKASLYAIAHAHASIRDESKQEEQVKTIPLYNESGTTNFDEELFQLAKTYMPHKNYGSFNRMNQKNPKEAANNLRSKQTASRKLQRETAKQQSIKPIKKAAPVAPQTPSPKRQKKSFSLNKSPG